MYSVAECNQKKDVCVCLGMGVRTEICLSESYRCKNLRDGIKNIEPVVKETEDVCRYADVRAAP